MWHILIIACSAYAPADCYPSVSQTPATSLEDCKRAGLDAVAGLEWHNPGDTVKAWTCRGPAAVKGATFE